MTMIEFHKIWIEQCEGARGIKEEFGTEKALRCMCTGGEVEMFPRGRYHRRGPLCAVLRTCSSWSGSRRSFLD